MLNKKKSKRRMLVMAFSLLLVLSLCCCGSFGSDFKGDFVSNFVSDFKSNFESFWGEIFGQKGDAGSETAAAPESGAAAGDAAGAEAAGAGTGGAGAALSYDSTLYDDPEICPYYAQLEDAEKQAYIEILQYAEQGVATYKPEVSITEDELVAAVKAVYLDQPQLFWMESTPEGGYVNNITGMVTSVTLGYNELVNDLQANIAAFDAAAQAALAGLDGLSDVEKERAIHDYLAEHITYQYNSYDQNAYGALVNGACVCNGYAQAFQYLLKCEGIKAYFVSGQACANGVWDNHAWDIVKLGDSYYNVDVTWDDQDVTGTFYTYYNVTDGFIAADHTRSDDCAFLPDCSGTEYSFESVYGMTGDAALAMSKAEQRGLTEQTIITSVDQFDETVKNALIGAGAGSYTICYLVYGDECVQEINQMFSDKNAVEEHIMSEVASSLGMLGYSWSTSFSGEQLAGAYYYLTLNITITAC